MAAYPVRVTRTQGRGFPSFPAACSAPSIRSAHEGTSTQSVPASPHHLTLRRARTARGDVWTGAWVSLLQCPCPLPAPCPHPCLFLPGLNRHLWEFQAYASPFLTSPGRGLKLRVVGRGERGYLLPRARSAHVGTNQEFRDLCDINLTPRA